MGKYKSIARITATVADLTLCSDGTARMKSSLTKERWQNDPDFQFSRVCSNSFAGANKCASQIYNHIPEDMRKCARSHAHNHIARHLRQATDTTRAFTNEYNFEMALPALHRLDLSRAPQLGAKVSVSPIGNPLQPTGLHIQGLRDAARSIPTRAGHQLQLSIHFAFVAFAHVRCNSDGEWNVINRTPCHDEPASAWIDPRMIPSEGIAMSLQNPNPSSANILFMSIEWRHVPTDGTRAAIPRIVDPTAPPCRKARNKATSPIDLSQFGIFKVAALLRPQHQLHLPVPTYMLNRVTQHYRPRKVTRRFPKISPALKYLLAMPRHIGHSPLTATAVRVGFAPELLPQKRRSTQKKASPARQQSKVRQQNLPQFHTPLPLQQTAPASTTENTQGKPATESAPKRQHQPTPPKTPGNARQPRPHRSPVSIRPATLPNPSQITARSQPDHYGIDMYSAQNTQVTRTYYAQNTLLALRKEKEPAPTNRRPLKSQITKIPLKIPHK